MFERLARVGNYLRTAFLVMMLIGNITFAQFILQEAAQHQTWGCFPLSEAKAWEAQVNCGQKVNTIGQISRDMNRLVGWLNPFTFVAYREYSDAAMNYGDNIIRQACAHEPRLPECDRLNDSTTPTSR